MINFYFAQTKQLVMLIITIKLVKIKQISTSNNISQPKQYNLNNTSILTQH